MKTAEIRGREKGEKIGKEIGEKIGKEIGKEIGKKLGIKEKAKETAIKAMEMGMDNDVIMSLTGLSDKEISEIRLEISEK